MSTDLISNPWNTKTMAVLKSIPDGVNCDRIEKVQNTCDEIDNPKSYYVERSISDENKRNEELFKVMKFEINRLNSFTGKWPLRYVKPKELAANGFFYLQSEDQVQCAFCGVVIQDWNVGEKPLKEHMKKAPKCAFLMTSQDGNVPIPKQKPVETTSNKCVQKAQATNSSYKPKYPKMADLKNRLMTYRDWPLIMLGSKQLAECGLYYTGVADVVTCFFCGGSLGNWELNDDPWVEHRKFFPNCGYLDLVRIHGRSQGSAPISLPHTVKANGTPAVPLGNLRDSIQDEIIRQACDIFPKSLVQKVVEQHFLRTRRQFTSLHDLCEDILEHKEKESVSLQSSASNGMPQITVYTAASTKTSNAVGSAKDICKICMDEEPNVVFEPCCHLVSCMNCASQIYNCPLCRAPITNKMKVFRG